MSPAPTRTVHLLSAAAAALLLFGAATPATAAAPAGQILHAGGPTAVAGSYIVVLADTPSLRSAGVSGTARSLADRHDARIRHTYTSALRGFAAEMTEADARALAADASVAYVEQDHVVRALGTQTDPPSWGLDRIDQRDLPLNKSYTYPTGASNVRAYIIDTGVLTTHPTFGGRASHGRDLVDNDNDATDCQGHGTHVAGTVGGAQYGVAKEVRIVGVRVLDCQGSGSNAGVIAGVDWVTANAVKPAVANMSLGGGSNTALDTAVTNSVNSGIPYAVAAGNGNIFGQPVNACTVSPAKAPAAITVGATQITDAKASFSNFGTCLDIFAPGVNITSSWLNNGTNSISGTSMAAPHVAGAAALYLAANPTATAQQVRDALVAAATPGKVTGPGAGSPNRLLFAGGGTPGPGPDPQPGPDYFENTTDVAIPDWFFSAASDITVSGRAGKAPSGLKVSVDIKHPNKGDLVVDLLAPDGTVYNLHNRAGGSGDDIIQSYSVDASSETANGVWRLRASDRVLFNTGRIDKWSLQF